MTAFHHVFHTELSTLSASELSLCGISLRDFRTRESLLEAATQYRHNPIVSWRLFIMLQPTSHKTQTPWTSLKIHRHGRETGDVDYGKPRAHERR